MINTVSLHWFSQKLYENVLQNVLTDWMSRKSRNFSQISPRRYILAKFYFRIQSKGAVEIFASGEKYKNFATKGEPPPPPTWRKWSPKGKQGPTKGETGHFTWRKTKPIVL